MALPWRQDELHVGLVARAAMVASGVAVLLVAAWRPLRDPPVPRTTAQLTGVLGAAVLLYPTSLSLWGAGLGGPGAAGVLEVLAMGGHVVPLVLFQLLPVVASGAVTNTPAIGTRSPRRGTRTGTGVLLVLALVVASNGLSGYGLRGGPGAAAAGVAGSLLWVSSFAVPSVVTWAAVRGTAGEVRRRAVVAAVAALAPVLVITACWVLGAVGAALGADDTTITLLYLGFSGGVLASAVLSVGAVQARDALVRTRVVVGVLDLLLGLVGAVVFAWLALAVSRDLPTGWAVVVGGAAVAALGLPWLRWHGWVARVVDPAAELRHELAADTGGEQRRSLERVLRRVVGDPNLAVRYPTADAPHTAEDEDDDGDGVVLAHSAGAPAVVVLSSSPAARARLRRLGDCSDLLRPAVLEAQLDQADQLARLAASLERRRLSQDLHDGLQGRLLGLALHLQLSSRDVDDPTSRLLLEQAVDVLRRAVDDVRAVADDRLPQLLVEQGLGPALTSLFGQLRTRVEERPAVVLDVPATRLAAPAEATAYFVVSEAVANALKHAQASRVVVRVSEPSGGRVVVTVDDDGTGGADPRTGSGLRGLAERVRSADGLLVVRDGSGPERARGTVVEAVLPCGS